jgi:hypothetical protein
VPAEISLLIPQQAANRSRQEIYRRGGRTSSRDFLEGARVSDLSFWHERMSDSTPMSFCRIASLYCGLRIADCGFPSPKSLGRGNPQSAIRNELQAVKQWYHLEKDILKHSQIKMSVTVPNLSVGKQVWSFFAARPVMTARRSTGS